MHPKPRADLPFSRPIDVDRLPETGLDIAIEASLTECAAVAVDAGLPAVGALSAHLRIDRREGQRFEVSGELTARITQICVVSLELFESEVEHDIDVAYVKVTPQPSERSSRRQTSVVEARSAPPASPSPDLDAPDPIVDGIIDLGAVAYEFLMLARDLYPRKPGVSFTDTVVGEEGDPEPKAFSALQRLKDRS